MAATRRGFRQLLLDIHLYLSLALGLVIVAVAVTGAPLVWRDQVDRFLNPDRYAISGAEIRLTPSGYVANALAAAGPDFRAVDLRYPAAPGWPLRATVRAAPKDGGAARSLVVTLDPPTGKVLGVAGVSATFVGALHNFHHMLMIPQFSGRQIVGWIGVALLFLSLSGIYLWWPRNAPFARGLRWRRSPFTTTNLHHLVGFWISVPLAIVSLSGVYLAFPNTAYSLMSGVAAMSQPMRRGGFSALPARDTNIDADRALAQALALTPGAAPRIVSFPVAPRGSHEHGQKASGAEWRIQARAADASEATTILVDDQTAVARPGPAPQSGDRAASLIKGLHEARRGGVIWEVLVFLTGVTPLLFLVTGVMMWLRGRKAAKALEAARGAPRESDATARA